MHLHGHTIPPKYNIASLAKYLSVWRLFGRQSSFNHLNQMLDFVQLFGIDKNKQIIALYSLYDT